MPKGPEVWRRGPKNFLGGGSFFPTPGGFGFSGSWERSQNLSLGGMGGIKKKKIPAAFGLKILLGGGYTNVTYISCLGGTVFRPGGGGESRPMGMHDCGFLFCC